jgi:hypothetical protein
MKKILKFKYATWKVRELGEKKQNYTERRLQRTVKTLLSYIPSAHFKVIGESLLGKCSKWDFEYFISVLLP